MPGPGSPGPDWVSVFQREAFAARADRRDALITKVAEVGLFAQDAFGKKISAPVAEAAGVAALVGNLDFPVFRFGLGRHLRAAVPADVLLVLDRQKAVLGLSSANRADSFFHLCLRCLGGGLRRPAGFISLRLNL